jgi:intein/homing endonuclease
MGLDLRVAAGAKRGSDNKLYATVKNIRTGQLETVSARDLASKVVTFPGELSTPDKRVPAIKNDNIVYVNKDEVDYEVPSANGMFSKASLLIPQFEGVKSGRLLMGARMSVSGDTAVLIRRLDGTAYYGPIEGYVFTPGDKSLSINKKTCQLEWMDIVGFIPHKNVKKMYRVELASGRYVDATADHSFVTIGDDGYLKKMYTQDMVPGTAIPIAGVIPAVGKEFTDNWVVNGGNKHNSHSGAEFKLDFQLGWIHGMYLSEGYGCGNDRNGEKTYVTFANCDLDVLDRVAKFFCDIGIGCKPMSGRADGKLDRVRVYWKQLYEKLKEDFGDGAYNKRIPGWVFFAPEEFRRGLLAGYIAGDGGVQRRRDRVRINGSSRSKELIVGLGNLCTSLGIATTQDEREVNTGPGGAVATQHYFEVRSEHTSLVPTLCCERKDAIIRAAAPWSGKKSADWMPIYASLKQQIVGLSSRRSTARHKIYVDQHTKQSVKEALGETAASVPWLNSGVKWDKVKSIRQLDESDYEYVYDIDMGDNVFMCANGIFVHNTQQAVPLIEPEAPLVQTADDDGTSLHSSMSKFLGAKHAPADGIVTRVTPDFIEISTKEGKKIVDLYNNYHTGRKSFMHNEALVQPGQSVAAGQLLARSNYTDKNGVMSVGRNLRTAYMTAEGDTIEDAYVISESAAKKLGAQAMYKSELDTKNLLSTKKDDYVAIYADKFNNDQYSKLDDSGIIRVGETVKAGDPLILGIGKKPQSMVGAVMNTPKSSHSDLSQTWDHKSDGIVTDIVNTKDGIRVYVKSLDNVDHADKICMRYGNKGVVVVRPDDQMPIDEEGNTIDVLVNTNGVIGRINPSTLAEQLLGKVAAKTGKPYVVKAFGTPDVAEFALNEAAKHGIKELETVTDPRDGRKIPGIFVGNGYVMRLTHKAEGKMSARDSGSYTTSGYPAKGGFEGSKRISLMDNSVLLAAGATNFLKDAKLVRGQRNDDYWRAIRNGEEPVLPDGAIADQEFLDMLTAAGVHVQKDGTKEKLRPLLDRDVDEIARHEIGNSKTFDFESMEPIKDGLFDIGKTGGADGNMYAKITLPEKIPHPLFIDPIQKLLGITNKTLLSVLSGQEQLNGNTGPAAIEAALKGVDINRDMEACKVTIRTGKQGQKDAAVRKLNYLAGLKKMEVKPEELMVSKIPVIPPKYRPIMTGTNTDMVHDFNYLYHDLLEAKQNYLDAKNEIGSTADEYLTLLKAVRAIAGAEDPVNKEHAEQGVKGILRYAIGLGDSPKFSNYQRRVIGQSVDQVGRGVITADGTLKMDEVGVPFEMAWNIYKPYIIRRLVQAGKPASEAVLAVQNRAEDAKKALLEEVKVRPVAYNRAPALHQYAYFAGWPKLTDDHAIRVPYTSYAGLGADNDGDAINIHVPSTREAIKDLEDKLMPSKRLFSSGNFQAHMLPMQDYIAGMYLASQINTNEPVKTFQTVQDAKRAYARGDISARTPIRVLQG